jgi:hypothetical protein
MKLDNFIVEQVIGLVDVAEHNAAFVSVSVLTAARPPFCKTGRSRCIGRRDLAHEVHAHQAWHKLAESAGVPTNPAA